MNVTIIGTGYVGLVSGTCLAEVGHHVQAVDNNATKIAALQQGHIPIYEPGLDTLVQRNTKQDRLHFTTDLADAMHDADMIIIAVGTPTRKLDGNADLQYVYAAAAEIAQHLNQHAVIVTKSTVPAGTNQEIRRIITAANPTATFDIASNPEFLREGNAITDFMEPDRIVVGTDTPHGKATMDTLYAPFTEKGHTLIHTDIISSELIKYASNTFLAAKVSFINEMADLCERLGGNIEDVAKGMGSDHRIGMPFLRPGPGYGGSCFPKDTLAMVTIGERALSPATIVEAVIAVNRARPHRMVAKIVEAAKGDVRNKTIALLGLTFKPNTDDVRDSVAILIASELAQAGAKVIATDPEGISATRNILADQILYADTVENALDGADIAVLATEWDIYARLQPEEIKHLLKYPVMVDLRNAYDCAKMRQAGFTYYSIGRPPIIET